MSNTLTLVQEVYFDLCDVLNGNSYTELGYENRKHFLMEQINKLEAIEKAVEPDPEIRCNH
jgi:hypothetical protein